MAVPQLSETHLNQLLNQIKELNYYDGAPGKLSGFVNQVEQLLSLYPTQEARQAHVIYGAVKRLLVDSALEVVTQERANTWLDMKKALAMAFKDHRPYVTLIRQLEDISYPGSICKFIEKLETQYWIMFDKLELESDHVDKSNYTEMLNKTIKSVIDRKLPDRIYMSLARKDIDTIYKLKQASMELGLYDAIPENHRSNRTEMNKRRNRGNYNQNNNQKYYNNRNHNYSNYYPSTNQNHNTQPPQNSTQPMTNQNQYSPRFIPNNQRGNYYAFRRDLTQAQQNNPLNNTLNFQPSTSNNINRQGPVKRQRESQSDQSRMDVNFHQAASDTQMIEKDTQVPM